MSGEALDPQQAAVEGFSACPGGSVLVPETLDDLINTTEAAEMCGVAKSTISMWAARRLLAPDGLDPQGRPLYKRITILRVARDTRHRAVGARRIA